MSEWCDEVLAERERDDEAWLASLPVCDNCKEPIQDDYFYILPGGFKICPDCLKECREYTDNWLDE